MNQRLILTVFQSGCHRPAWSACLLAAIVLLAVTGPAWGSAATGAAALRLNTPDPDELIVVLDPTYDPAEVAMSLATAGFPTVSRLEAVPDRFHYRLVPVGSVTPETLAAIRGVPGVVTVRRIYAAPNSVAPIIHTGEVIAKFAAGTDPATVQALAVKHGGSVKRPIHWLAGGYILEVPDTDTTDAMTAAIALAAEPQTVYSHPDFFIKGFVEKDAVEIEDPLFPFQWHLRNTAQLAGGKVGADINVLPAWEITQGEGAVVAVIDDCVQKDHEDLEDNYRTGFDFNDDDGDPSPAFPGEGHGTATAGIAAARANNIGLRGVAPRASLIGVRALGSTIQGLADAFIFCETNGADVISNSWGLNYNWAPTIPPLLDTVLADAVKRVATIGRAGKGTVVCFSAGNLGILMAFNRPTAAQPYVIGCGATLRDDNFACYSSFGPELSVVAPGGGSLGECFDSDVATTDVQDSLVDPTLLFPFGMRIRGMNPATKFVLDPASFNWLEVIDTSIDDFPDLGYTHHMNGTSAATPVVAGVATLVTSVNNTMTAREVKNLIEHTALKITSPSEHFDAVTGHNIRFGHGRVDAHRAVLAAQAARSWPSPVKNIQNISSQSLARLIWENPDWDGDDETDGDVSGVLVARATAGQLNWAPVDGVGYAVGQIVAPGVVIVANDYITTLDDTGLSRNNYEYGLFVRNAANYYSWGRRTSFSSTGAVSVPLASIQTSTAAGPAPLKVHFAGGGIDEGGITSFIWSFGDGATGSGPAIDHTYSAPGEYLAYLTVTNTNGQTAQTSVRVSVTAGANSLPVVSASANPKTGTAPLVVLFQGTATDPDGTIVRYDWDFGDGSVASGRAVEHIYLDLGTYGATLTATDNSGGQAMTFILVTVNAPTTTAAEVVSEQSTSSQNLPAFCGSGTGSALLASAIGLCGLLALRRRH